jgi:hypothetical protein
MDNMIPIAKAKLEQVCLLYLNHRQRARAIDEILLDRPAAGQADWTISGIYPRIDLRDVKNTFLAIRELQSVFCMVV